LQLEDDISQRLDEMEEPIMRIKPAPNFGCHEPCWPCLEDTVIVARLSHCLHVGLSSHGRVCCGDMQEIQEALEGWRHRLNSQDAGLDAIRRCELTFLIDNRCQFVPEARKGGERFASALIDGLFFLLQFGKLQLKRGRVRREAYPRSRGRPSSGRVGVPQSPTRLSPRGPPPVEDPASVIDLWTSVPRGYLGRA
jgi:hypothetical protein